MNKSPMNEIEYCIKKRIHRQDSYAYVGLVERAQTKKKRSRCCVFVNFVRS